MREKDRERFVRDLIMQLIVGLLVALFSFWLNKTFGNSILGGMYG